MRILVVAALLLLAGCSGSATGGPTGSQGTGGQGDFSQGDATLTDVVLVDGWLNADGTELVVDSRYGVPRWSTETGELLTTDEDPDRVGIPSPDGSRLAALTDDGEVAQIVIRNADDGSEITRLDGPPVEQVTDSADRPLTDLAFSPDGERMAASSRDGRVWLWDIDAGITSGFELPGLLNGVAWNPSGERLAVTIADQPAVVVDLQMSELFGQAQSHELSGPAQRDIAWSPDGQWIASVGTHDGNERRATVWDAETFEGRYFKEPPTEINDITFAHNSEVLAITRDEEPEVLTWEFQTDAMVTMPDPPEVAREVLWAPDDSRIYAIGDHQVASWDVESRSDPLVFEEHPAVAEVLSGNE